MAGSEKKGIINVHHSENSRGRMNPYHGFVCASLLSISLASLSLSLSLIFPLRYATVFNPIQAQLARGKVKYNKWVIFAGVNKTILNRDSDRD